MPNLQRYTAARELPEMWDSHTHSFFQCRAFLHHCESYNPCNQRYYSINDATQNFVGVIVYTLKIDILTYLGIKSPMQMHIVGIPCSVSAPGIIGDHALYPDVLNAIRTHEKGFILTLNLDQNSGFEPFILGRTWPTVILKNQFNSWEHYIRSIRSSYRRRIHSIEKFAQRYATQTTGCNTFSDIHYTLYENVLKRSKGKLEHLSLEFFVNLPFSFQLTTFTHNTIIKGWVITQDSRTGIFAFFLGGQVYDADSSDLYHVKLLTLVKQGITAHAQIIELGQSAVVPKMRMGGELCEKQMLAWHSIPLIRIALRAARGLLSYNDYAPSTRVFQVENK